MDNIVFDFDGTLLDSRKRHTIVLADAFYQICSRVLEQPLLDGYLLSKSSGINTYNYLYRIVKLESDFARKIADQWQKLIELPEYLIHDVLYPDSIDCLEQLKKTYNLFLVSARSNSIALNQQVKTFGIDQYFKKIICVSPNNAVKNKTSEIKRIVPCLVVGDSEIDRDAAIKSNVTFYVLNRGFRNKSFWEAKGVKSFPDLSEINNILKNIGDIK